ncbi:MAG: tRNA pseudouridine(55) synthase TruB [Gemmatimonadota bacterium]|jgi:tRNA pseudouridine55 synthase|nr:tRNA pseudouridine(55) synthase TruB [Gemmatimonadota bacterium]
MNPPNGVLPVDKPVGLSSHDVVAVARRALGERRIGHTGTLDPFASGLLLLCLGPATRLSEYLTGLPKSYRATMRLGVTTDTDDTEGTVVQVSDSWGSVTREAVAAAMEGMTGPLLQRPPRYSAKKVGGERAYAAARAGRDLVLEPVPVCISRFEILRFDAPEVEFEVDCSSGTYIRSIARDLGELLGVGAHLTALRRTRVGERSVEGALPLDALGDAAAVKAAMISPADAVDHLPAFVLDDQEMSSITHGGSFIREGEIPAGVLVLLSPERQLLAIGEGDGERIRPRKVFL